MLKGWKTVLGILILALTSIGATLGVPAVPIEESPQWVQAGLALIGAIVAIYGRYDAGKNPTMIGKSE